MTSNTTLTLAQLEQKNSKIEKELDSLKTKAPKKRAAYPKRIAKIYAKQKAKDEEKAARTRLEKSLKTALCRSSGTGLRHNRWPSLTRTGPKVAFEVELAS